MTPGARYLLCGSLTSLVACSAPPASGTTSDTGTLAASTTGAGGTTSDPSTGEAPTSTSVTTTTTTTGEPPDTTESSSTGEPPPPPFPPPSTPTVFPTPEQREANWTAAGPWEMAWEGEASAADLPRPYHTWFDNPHDDDLNAYPEVRGACRYRFDDPAPGFMTVDRVNTPEGPLCPLSATGHGGRTFTGNVWKRDEYLSHAAGLTLEVDVEIPDKHIQSQHEAFSIVHVGTAGSFALYLSPDCVKLGRLKVPDEDTRHQCLSTPTATARALDASGPHRYRLTLGPGSLDVVLYVDDDPTPFLERTGEPLPFVRLYAPGEAPLAGDVEYEHPYLLLGDNTGSSAADVAANIDVSAAYVLDGIRWTRGVFPPGAVIAPPAAAEGPLRARVPPQLPANTPVIDPGLEFDAPLAKGLAGDAVTTFVVGRLDGDEFVATKTPPPGQGVLAIQGSASGSYLQEQLPGLLGNGAWLLETRLRVLPGTTERALAINIWDQIGMITLMLSPDKVELVLGGKFRGISDPIVLDTTDGFHTYRLARKQNDHLVYLFIDDLERPAIADFAQSGVQMNGPYRAKEFRLWFGFIAHLMPVGFVEQGDGEFAGVHDSNIDVLIDHFRWTSDVPLGAAL